MSMDLESVNEFLRRLNEVPWFSALGDPVSEQGVPRINNWEEWKGPESAGGEVIALSIRHQAWHDALLADHPERETELASLWKRVVDRVMAAAADKVPYDPDADAWHPPTAAVWQAEWTAGLVAWHLACGVPIPADLAKQWDWYTRGHWPCAYAYLAPDGTPGPLRIY
jgi:hypothetical protein